jgi:hypothetical protein
VSVRDGKALEMTLQKKNKIERLIVEHVCRGFWNNILEDGVPALPTTVHSSAQRKH